MKWTISRKILAGYVFAIFLSLLVSLIAWNISLGLRSDFALRIRLNKLSATLNDIQVLVIDAETGQRGYLLTNQEEYLEPYKNAAGRLQVVLDDLDEIVREHRFAYTEKLASLHPKVAKKLAELDQTIHLHREKGAQAALDLVLSNNGKSTMDDIRGIINEVHMLSEKDLQVLREDTQENVKNLTYVLEIGAPLAIILMISMGVFIARNISQPLGKVAAIAGDISKGELTSKLDISERTDEIGTLADNVRSMVAYLSTTAEINGRIASGDLTVDIRTESAMDQLRKSQSEMVAKLSSLIQQVQRSGVQVNSSAVQIAATIKQQQLTSSEMASTTTEIGATAKEMSTTSTELLKTTDEVGAVAAQTSTLAGEGKKGIAKMEGIVRQIMEAAASVTAKLGTMNEKAGNINSVVTTITKVADQTNLLSLNAAIEAEKAGEYGRGFAVVATEIRRLADQTAASTNDIDQIVKEMVAAVSAGVTSMDKFTEEIRRSVAEIGQVSSQLDQVIAQVQSLPSSIETVNEGMRSQSEGSQQISEALIQLGDAARQTADSIRDSAQAVEHLHEATMGLQDSISRFKLKK